MQADRLISAGRRRALAFKLLLMTLVASGALWTVPAQGATMSRVVSGSGSTTGAVQAGAPTVSAVLKPAVIKLGGRAVFSITVEGSDQAQIVGLPEVDGLRFGDVYGPEVSRVYTSINGRREFRISTSFQIAIEAARTGEFEVPGPTIRIGGKDYTTQPRTLQVLEDLRGAELGFLRYEGAPARVVDGQPFRLDIVFGWDERLDSINYARLLLPWWDAVPGAIVEALPPNADGRPVEVGLNRDQRVSALAVGVETEAERSVLTYRLALRITPTRAGQIDFEGSLLEFAETRVQRDFLSSRQRIVEQFFSAPTDLSVEVRALPEAGQPLDFGGAIGALDVRATADTRDVRAGDSIKVTLDITGNGNLEFLRPPEPELQPAFEGFNSYGFTDEKLPDRRRVTYDLVPKSAEIDTIPSIELSTFDPEAWTYRRLETQPISIRVRPLEDRTSLGEEQPSEFKDDIRDIHTTLVRDVSKRARAPRATTIASAAFGLLLGWLALRTAVRQGGRDPGSALERRRRRALRRFDDELRASLDAETDLESWTRFLAARTGEEPMAWVGRDVQRWAAERERTSARAGGERLDPSSLATLERVGRELEAARFGGRARVRREELSASARELLEDGL